MEAFGADMRGVRPNPKVPSVAMWMASGFSRSISLPMSLDDVRVIVISR